MHRKKHAGEFLNVINESTGEIEQIKAADGDRSYADSSMVVFIKDRPVFALSGGGGNGSPRAARVADWLTGEVLVNGGDVFFDVVPLSTEPDLGSMVGADGARKVRFKVPAGSLRDEPDAGVVSRAFREIQNHLVDGYVEITLSVGRRKVTDKDRDTMLQFAQDLSDELVEGAAGEVGIVREVQGAKKNSVKLQSEMIDLVKHNIAEKFDLPVGSDELMIDLTFGNIERIIEKQQKLVDKALEAMGLTNGSLGAGG